ncbi:hypothetical protein [Psychromonas ossibalaenae]|uniref:hypothetical protein n=1 Tax=Psychromonas ossibalaenae TaxID=444922 RepID=UPI0003635A33|nr:hypothetical protein [Psychromonas ossibalaenae]
MKYKKSLTALSVGASLLSSNILASELISAEQYRALLPSDGYLLTLADKTTVDYHCDIKEEGERYVLDPETCDQRAINWESDYPDSINLGILGTPSELTIQEHKLWAMSFAHAAMNSMVLMQYALAKEGGTFDLERPFATGENFGDYFMRNMGPNYYLSKGLQESSLGDDLPDNPMGEGDDDGVLQVEYPGSAWAELQGVASGGFPAVFAAMNPEAVLSSNNGPARNILGSASTSAYYNASATAINTGSLEWDQNPDGQANPQNRLHEFIQGAEDPEALSKMLSFMYNRGPYAAKDQPLRTEEVFQHCMSLAGDLENDWTCFTKQNDFGTKYIRQIPDVTRQLLASEHSYEVQLTWNDLQAYLTLLTNYGFYAQADYDTLETAVKAVFDASQKDAAISYKNDFGKVIEAIITSVPIKTFSEKGPIDPSKEMPVYVAADILPNSMFMQAHNSSNSYIVNDYLVPNKHISLPVDTTVTTLSYSGADCEDSFNEAFQVSIENIDPENPIQLNILFEGDDCNIYESEYVEVEDEEPLPEGEWDPNKAYPENCTLVTYEGAEYKNEWYANPGEKPDPNNEWGVWRGPDWDSSTCN